jgi:thiamine transport system permease protein
MERGFLNLEKKRKIGKFAIGEKTAAVLPVAAVTAFFILPYGAALAGGFSGGGFSAGETGALLPTAFFTLKQAFLSAVASVALGLPGAWFVGTSDSRFARVLRGLTVIPFALPPILVVLGFVLFFGNAGWFNRFFTFITGKETGFRVLYQSRSIILAHAFYNFPLVIRLAGDGLARTRRAYAPAAAVLGASPLVTAWTVFLPAMIPSIIKAGLLAFLYSFMSFSIVLALGGGPQTTTLAVEIYRYSRVTLSFHTAGVFALVETLMVCAVFGISAFLERKTRTIPPETLERPMERVEKKSFSAERALLIAYFLIITLITLGPLASIIAESFFSRASRAGGVTMSLKWWRLIGERCLPALCRSLLLAFSSASVACVLAVAAGFTLKNVEKFEKKGVGKILSALTRFCVSAPLISSGIVLGLGFLALYGRSGGAVLIAALHAVTALPFAGNAVIEGFHQIPNTVLNAAESLGANPFKRLITVDIPLCSRHIRSAFGFSAAISLGELNAVMMLDGFETLPVLIYRLAASYRYGSAAAAGAILMLCCALSLFLADFSFFKGKEV